MSQQASKFELQKWWNRAVRRNRNANGFFNPTGPGRDSLSLPYCNPAVEREPCRNAGPFSLVCKFLRVRAARRLASSRPDICFVLLVLILYTSCFFFFKTAGERSIVTAEEKLMLEKLALGQI